MPIANSDIETKFFLPKENKKIRVIISLMKQISNLDKRLTIVKLVDDHVQWLFGAN